MNSQTRRWLEKTEVRVAAVAAAAVAWFAIWRAVRPPAVQAALAFVPSGDLAGLLVFAALVWAMAAGCAALTLSARADGALVATLVGVAALGLHGGPMRVLLWQWNGDPGRLFLLLAGEMLILGGVLVGALLVVHLVRALIRAARPGWVWRGPEDEPASPAETPSQKTPPPGGVSVGLIWDFFRQMRSRPLPPRTTIVNAAGCLVMELAAAMILLVLTFRSTEKGQIAFALAASFFLAALAAHSAFPVRNSAPCWLGPVVMGAAVLALGGIGRYGGNGPVWYEALTVVSGLPLRAALPVHWLALGCGGAVAGYWFSCRCHEAGQDDQRASGHT